VTVDRERLQQAPLAYGQREVGIAVCRCLAKPQHALYPAIGAHYFVGITSSTLNEMRPLVNPEDEAVRAAQLVPWPRFSPEKRMGFAQHPPHLQASLSRSKSQMVSPSSTRSIVSDASGEPPSLEQEIPS